MAADMALLFVVKVLPYVSVGARGDAAEWELIVRQLLGSQPGAAAALRRLTQFQWQRLRMLLVLRSLHDDSRRLVALAISNALIHSLGPAAANNEKELHPLLSFALANQLQHLPAAEQSVVSCYCRVLESLSLALGEAAQAKAVLPTDYLLQVLGAAARMGASHRQLLCTGGGSASLLVGLGRLAEKFSSKFGAEPPHWLALHQLVTALLRQYAPLPPLLPLNQRPQQGGAYDERVALACARNPFGLYAMPPPGRTNAIEWAPKPVADLWNTLIEDDFTGYVDQLAEAAADPHTPLAASQELVAFFCFADYFRGGHAELLIVAVLDKAADLLWRSADPREGGRLFRGRLDLLRPLLSMQDGHGQFRLELVLLGRNGKGGFLGLLSQADPHSQNDRGRVAAGVRATLGFLGAVVAEEGVAPEVVQGALTRSQAARQRLDRIYQYGLDIAQREHVRAAQLQQQLQQQPQQQQLQQQAPAFVVDVDLQEALLRVRTQIFGEPEEALDEDDDGGGFEEVGEEEEEDDVEIEVEEPDGGDDGLGGRVELLGRNGQVVLGPGVSEVLMGDGGDEEDDEDFGDDGDDEIDED